jgi:two-component system, LuxR family, response regulator FixJ
LTELVVHVVDDDEGMRQSLGFLLDTAGFKAEIYGSAAEFLAVGTPAAGCIVTDVRMPDMSGLELMEALNARGSSLPVVVITGHGDVPMAVAAMKAGAVDFLEKPFGDEALLRAVKAAFAHTPADADDPERARVLTLIEGLSPRELDVLRGLIGGGSNKTIAIELGISPRTVEIYRANLMLKTGAGSLAELVRMTMLAGFQ